MSVLTLYVDEVMRTLSAESSNPFVVHDKEVDIVRFAINSGFADIVLDGQVALRVMYQRPGETEVRAQTLTYYDTDGLHNYYDWQLLSADLTKKGTLTVALCILRTDSEVEEWHTTPCQIRVLDTIHTDDSDEADETITPTVAQRVAILESMIQRVASGAPIVVSSASAMTDTDQIYVLSTDGNWYYHNGTTWVVGGEYGAVATDTTLSQAGIPADAEAVGDAIDTISENMRKYPSVTSGDGAADLYISDDTGNVIAKFQGGGFQVKKFKGFDFVTLKSETKVYAGDQLTFTVSYPFAKGDKVVLHMERGAMPWEYGAYVTYRAGQTVIKDSWRGDCAWLEYTLTEDVDEITAVYPASSSFVPWSTDITFEVSILGDVPITPKVITVKKDGTGDFTTLRGALDSIGTEANDVLNPYRIEIHPGVYDVLADYTDTEIRAAAYTQEGFVGPKLLNGMYLVGIGLPEEVVLIASLDPNTYDNNIRGAISTLNCQGTCGMENLTVEAHNIRYCVHDDYHTQLHKKPKRTVKNCLFRGYGVSYTPGTTYGAGTSPTGCDYEFINCDFGENAGVHTMPTTQFRSFVHLINCVGAGFRIGDNATTDIAVTGYDVYRFDNCGFPWIRNTVDGSVPHAIIKGSGNRSPLYQITEDTLYITDEITVVPIVNLSITGGVGTVVEWFSDSAHGPRFKAATSAKTATGVIVYQDSDNAYIQTKGYVCTNRTELTTFALGDYIGLSNGSIAVVSDRDSAFAKIRYIDASGLGYMMLLRG